MSAPAILVTLSPFLGGCALWAVGNLVWGGRAPAAGRGGR